MATHFSKDALKFLRGLKRNNDRLWFNERKDVYERELKEPLLALIGEVNFAMAAFSPEHVRPAPKIMMRIYRDIRFSKDKKPYKTHVSAWWAREGLEKTSGGGFYFHVSPEELFIAAGVYMPQREQLLAIRRHLATSPDEFRAIRKARALKRLLPNDNEQRTARVPKGFAADDPAADLVSSTQWGVSVSLSSEKALTPSLGKEIIDRFRVATPMITYLNTPLITTKRKPLF